MSFGLWDDHSDKVANLSERGQETVDRHHIVLMSLQEPELNFEPRVRSFSKSDEKLIDFGPAPGVEIVGILFRYCRIGMSYDDLAEFGAD